MADIKGQITIGPTENEEVSTYVAKGGAHNIFFLTYVSSDTSLIHQSKLVGFYRKVEDGDGQEVDPTPRELKDQIIKDTTINL